MRSLRLALSRVNQCDSASVAEVEDARKESRLVRVWPSGRRVSSVISSHTFSESSYARFESLPEA